MPRTPWYADGLMFECQQCGGCCGGFPGFVWLSDDDIVRISGHLGLPPDEFLFRYARQAMGRYTFKEVTDYDCIMLKEKRCSIYAVRPTQCRTFPFWDENLDTRKGWQEASRRCPGVDRGRRYTFEEIEQLRLTKWF